MSSRGRGRSGLTTTMFINRSKSGKGLTFSVMREVAGSFPRFHFCNAQAVRELLEGTREKAVPVYLSVSRTRQDREEEADQVPEEE